MLRAVAMLVAGLAVISAFPGQAEEYPARPVKLIVPFAAGGPADIYARFLAQRLEGALAQPLIVGARPGELFRPGAGGASRGCGEQSRRASRPREGEAREVELRVVGTGHSLSHGGRIVQSDGGGGQRPPFLPP